MSKNVLSRAFLKLILVGVEKNMELALSCALRKVLSATMGHNESKMTSMKQELKSIHSLSLSN